MLEDDRGARHALGGRGAHVVGPDHLEHGLKNALIPLVTVIALSLPGLVGGAVVTETIFAWPGMGRLFINALGQFDFALLMGYMMLTSFLVIAFNLIADVCYAWLDPRVKYS